MYNSSPSKSRLVGPHSSIALSGPCDEHLPITTNSPSIIFLIKHILFSLIYVNNALSNTLPGTSTTPMLSSSEDATNLTVLTYNDNSTITNQKEISTIKRVQVRGGTPERLVKMNNNLCKVCEESKDPTKARFVHSDKAIYTGIICKKKSSKSKDHEDIPQTQRRKGAEAVVPRLGVSEVKEMSCSWWTGSYDNKIAKLKIRSDGESIIKIPVSVIEFMLKIKYAVSNKHIFEKSIYKPEYRSDIMQYKVKIILQGVSVVINSRMYNCEGSVSYSSEVEFDQQVCEINIRLVTNEIIRVVESDKKMSNKIDPEYVRKVRNADHNVVDVSDIRPYKGVTMIKVDGMKNYVFCYESEYVVTHPDNDLTVIKYSVSDSQLPF
ncbi:hypothetical protein LZ554_007815 [Drepanopeziza brunnea f. sp. 'monogermtubi']|nr:hypothetical protein LZ554_007815 [Drepanopeziza brunnea f. sp. 'monogermtubi']